MIKNKEEKVGELTHKWKYTDSVAFSGVKW